MGVHDHQNHRSRSPEYAIVVDHGAVNLISAEVLAGIRVVVVPDEEVASQLQSLSGKVEFNLESLPVTSKVTVPAEMSGDDIAYIIFTSGTTGVPKGVMVNCASVDVYLKALGGLKAMTPDDRASQFTELSFDPSLGEIFVPLIVGASLHVVPSVNAVSTGSLYP